MQRIGIIFISTGIYNSFWKDFYESVHRFFCTDGERHFYLFTDSAELLNTSLPNVHSTYMDDQGWVMNVMRRSELFLSIASQLSENDFVFNLNSNYRPVCSILCSDVLPQESNGWLTTLCFDHYLERNPDTFYYERRSVSRAYIPFGSGRYYFQGGFYGGRVKEFLEMSRIIKEWTDTDITHNIIPIYHDESYVNRYMLDKKPRMLGTEYAWAEENGPLNGLCNGLLLDKEKIFGRGVIGVIKSASIEPTLTFLVHDESESRPIGVVNLLGGLGNQMFEYAFMLGLRDKFNNRNFYANRLTLPYLECHEGYQLDEIFGINDEELASEDLMNQIKQVPIRYKRNINELICSKYEEIKDSGYSYPIWEASGYWQNELYFGHKVRDVFRFDPGRMNDLSRQLLLEIQGCESVAVHVRRGDYVENIKVFQMMGNICNEVYYREAMSKFIHDEHFYVFSDDPEWCRLHLFMERVTIVDHNKSEDSWQDMALMSFCKHQIIANSSFSWWAAWLNENPDKRVIVPPRWYKAQPCYNLIPKGWEVLQLSKPEFDYNDLTIIIPVCANTEQRKRNLQIVLRQFEKLAHLHFIVLEADIKSRIQLGDDVRYVYVHDSDPFLDRMRYINILSKLVDTDYIGVWESDVFVPEEQIRESLLMLRQDKTDMVYPYDGRLEVVHPFLLEQLIIDKEETILDSLGESSNIILDKHSFDGAFMASRSAYLNAGGENERLRGCCYLEGLERNKRWEVKGWRIERVKGKLYYLDYPKDRDVQPLTRVLRRQGLEALLDTCSLIRDIL